MLYSTNFWLRGDLKAFKNLFKNFAISTQKFDPNTIIRCPGYKADNLYYLIEGLVKASMTNSNGLEKTIGYHMPGTLFGLDSLVENEDTLVTFTPITDTLCYELSNVSIKNMILEDKMFAIKIAEYYCKVLRLMCLETANQSFNNATARVSNFLYMYYLSTRDNGYNHLYLTQEEVSSIVNVSRVQVARIYRLLREKDIIETGRGQVTITNPGNLYSFCHFS
ncbi:MAG TPA: Crp/Fnr family transcriptional regulator [Clostridia bacterium]|nr:Crp/Fnr family transcriptional regulator [Clostridia bacterium]